MNKQNANWHPTGDKASDLPRYFSVIVAISIPAV
jgi:hypothetical protein